MGKKKKKKTDNYTSTQIQALLFPFAASNFHVFCELCSVHRSSPSEVGVVKETEMLCTVAFPCSDNFFLLADVSWFSTSPHLTGFAALLPVVPAAVWVTHRLQTFRDAPTLFWHESYTKSISPAAISHHCLSAICLSSCCSDWTYSGMQF